MNKKFKCDIFISWSYATFTQRFAEKLKQFICDIYRIEEKRIFVSSQDLHGKDWVSKIQKVANSCKIGISCMTSSTKKNEWLIYELGAMSYKTEVILVAIDFPRYELTADFYSPYPCKSGVQEDMRLDTERINGLITSVFEELSDSKAFRTITGLSKTECLNNFFEFRKGLKYQEEVETLFKYYNSISTGYLYFISRPMRDYSGSNDLSAILNELFSGKIYEKDVYFSKNPKMVLGDDARFLGRERVENIKNSGMFVLIWPNMNSKATLSSCLMELGAALSLNKSILVFIEKGAEEPSFFKEFSEKELVEYKNNEELKKLLESHIIMPLNGRYERKEQNN